MEELLHESKDFYQLKDLEKLAPKSKGIVAQSVKDIVQSLVDDGIVNTEKIGTSNYYWAFTSQALNQRQNNLSKLKNELEQINLKVDELKRKMVDYKEDNEIEEKRAILQEEMNTLSERNKILTEELSKYKDRDPVLLKKKKIASMKAKNAANRWTDNVFIIQKYCMDKFGISSEQFNNAFNVPEDFDNFE